MRSRFTLRRTRLVQVIIAATMLVVPASAFALTGATNVPTAADQSSVVSPVAPLRLRVSPGRVQFGHAVTVTGTAAAIDVGRRVALQTAATASSTWRQTAVATVGPSGRFRFHFVPRRSGTVRAVLPAAPSAVPTASLTFAGAKSSEPRPMTVSARFSLAAGPAAVVGGAQAHLTGRLLPAMQGRLVQVQGHTAQGWRTLATGRTGFRGGFQLTFRPAAGSGQRLRLLFSGDGRNGRAVQGAGSVAVLSPSLASWYEDGGSTACGFHAGLGVANRTLPCGSRVTLSYGGRSVTAVVDDRGPYVGGRTWDLNQNTAAALGFSGVGTVWTS